MATTPHRLARMALGLALLSVLSIAFADVRVARLVAGLPEGVSAVCRSGTELLDLLTGKRLGDWIAPLALLLVAAALARLPAARALPARLALVGLANALAHLAVGVLKPTFGRLRPGEIASGDWVDRFFAGGRSLPSGHTAFYVGLALPCALLFRHGRIALVPAAFVVASRVLVNDHFVGDVLGALALTTGVTAGLLAVFARRGWLVEEGHQGP